MMWEPATLWTHVVSDALIGLAYLVIPTALAVVLLRRRDFPFAYLLWLTVAFVFSCGLTHVFGIATIWRPLYWAEGLIKAGTAIVSAAAAIALIPAIPKFLSLRSARELEEAYDSLAAEVVERRRLEAEREDLASRLIQAQEDERSQIAREIHDDFSQRLAGLSMDLTLLKERPVRDPEKLQARLAGAVDLVQQLAMDLQNFSRGLHSSVLDKAGLTAALRADCGAFARRTEIDVECEIPASINSDRKLNLSLYRIAQEALSNVARHSGATRVRLSLKDHDDAVELTISDNGRGFDPEAVGKAPGLGLVSMKERLRPLRGRLKISAKPKAGVTISAWAPKQGNPN